MHDESHAAAPEAPAAEAPAAEAPAPAAGEPAPKARKKRVAPTGPADEIAVLSRVSKQLEQLNPAQLSWAMAFLGRKFAEPATLPVGAGLQADDDLDAACG